MSEQLELDLLSPAATDELGAQLAPLLSGGGVVYLYGDLGAGKTSLARAILKSLGYQGRVKSPTYTLVEPYELEPMTVYHMDLYRLSDPGELEYLGIREMIDETVLCLIEWPDHGAGYISRPDLIIKLEYLSAGRSVTLDANTERGVRILGSMTLASK